MKSARVTLPEEPANGVTVGIDGSRDDHAVSVVDARGQEISRRTVGHSLNPLARPTRAGVMNRPVLTHHAYDSRIQDAL